MIFFQPAGNGPLHRLPPATKLAALFALSVLVFALPSALALGVVAALVLGTTLLLCRPALWQWLSSWPLLLTIALVAGWTAFAKSPDAGLVVALRLGALSLFATTVTATTTIGQFIETITALARPLERLGLGNAADIGLAIGLVIRFVPEVQTRYRAVIEAHRARGLKIRPATLLVPMIIGTLQSADDIANAIDARCIRPEPTKPN